jgi:tRNA (cmo5U34)-methyltransferase
MIMRSVPLYPEQQQMIAEIAKTFWIPGTRIYDLGCSTGTTLLNIRRKLPDAPPLIGYDNSLPMLERARAKIRARGSDNTVEVRFGDLNGDLSKLPLENASVVLMCWTLQFVRPLRRDSVIKWVYDRLREDGAFVLTEKILTNNSHTNRFFIDWYYQFKRRNGYSTDEISRKRESLENVLIPYRLDENLELLRRNGFEIVETFFQWYNFAGFLCVKKPSPRRARRRVSQPAC